MRTKIDPEALAAFGLADDDLGEPEVLEVADHAAHGAGVAAEVMASGFRKVDYQTVVFPSLARLGIRTEVALQNRQLVAMHVPEDVDPSAAGPYWQIDYFRPHRPRDEFLRLDDDDPRTVYFRVDGADYFSFDLRVGGFVVRPSAGGLARADAGPVVLPKRATAFRAAQPLLSADFDTPVATWVDPARDNWLHGLLTAYATSASPWKRAVAAGAFARLRSHPPAGAMARVQQILAGQADDDLDRSRSWARSLSTGQVETLELCGLAEAAAIQGELEGLLADPVAGEGWWVDAVRVVLHRRDDLEAARLLLRFVERAASLETLLVALDEEGADFVRSIPRIPALVDDERLSRVLRVDPVAWWALPALRG